MNGRRSRITSPPNVARADLFALILRQTAYVAGRRGPCPSWVATSVTCSIPANLQPPV